MKRKKELERKENFLKEIFGEIQKYIEDENVSEISLNQDGRIFLDIRGKGYIDSGEKLSRIAGENIIKIVSAFNEKEIPESHP